MKKYLTLANALKCGAFVFGLVAFFAMFGEQLFTDGALSGGRYVVGFQDALFGSDNIKPAVLSTIGYFLMLVFALASVGLIFVPVDAKIKKFIFLGLGVLFIMAAIFVLVEGAVFSNANGTALTQTGYHLMFSPVISGILGILAGLLVAGSEFVPEMQLVK